MLKELKPGRYYIIVNLDEPYAEDVYKVLKFGQQACDEWPEGDIDYLTWVHQTWAGTRDHNDAHIAACVGLYPGMGADPLERGYRPPPPKESYSLIDSLTAENTALQQERDEAVAELAAERNKRFNPARVERMEKTNRRLAKEVHDLTVERNEQQASFDLAWKADMRAIEAWQEGHPERALTWPDRGRLVTWLLEREDALQQQVAELGAEATRLKEAIRHEHCTACSYPAVGESCPCDCPVLLLLSSSPGSLAYRERMEGLEELEKTAEDLDAVWQEDWPMFRIDTLVPAEWYKRLGASLDALAAALNHLDAEKEGMKDTDQKRGIT